MGLDLLIKLLAGPHNANTTICEVNKEQDVIILSQRASAEISRHFKGLFVQEVLWLQKPQGCYLIHLFNLWLHDFFSRRFSQFSTRTHA